MTAAATAAVALAAALDRAAGEPPERVHPVALFGRLVAPLGNAPRAGARLVGALAALCCPFAAAAVAWAVVRAAGAVGPATAAVAAGLVLFATTSLRLLVGSARAAIAAVEADPDAARAELTALVGRETGTLSAGELRSAAVESAAENLSDGLIAPLLAFAAGAALSLPLAAAGAAWVKAVNTMDSMFGYPDRPVGWASARLDDLVMAVPARASATLLAVAAGAPGALVRARRDARRPASPNAGWPMATLAAALGVRLEKPGAYALDGGGERALPTRREAERGVRVVGRAGLLAFGLAAAVVWFAGGGVTAPWF